MRASLTPIAVLVAAVMMMVSSSTLARGFTLFRVDVTDLFMTHEGHALRSAAPAFLEDLQLPSLDFELSFQGGSGPGFYSLADMLDSGFPGAMSVPEPTTITLATMGGLSLTCKRRT